jgi:hypothetical protein
MGNRSIDQIFCTREIFNSIPVMVPLTAPLLGSFLRGHISLKNWTYCPLLGTIQPLSKARVFLLSENERKLLCMGRTFTADKPLPLDDSPKELSVSWESNPACVKVALPEFSGGTALSSSLLSVVLLY